MPERDPLDRRRARGLPIGLDNCPTCGRITAYPQQFVADQVCGRCVDEGRPEALRIVEEYERKARARYAA